MDLCLFILLTALGIEIAAGSKRSQIPMLAAPNCCPQESCSGFFFLLGIHPADDIFTFTFFMAMSAIEEEI